MLRPQSTTVFFLFIVLVQRLANQLIAVRTPAGKHTNPLAQSKFMHLKLRVVSVLYVLFIIPERIFMFDLYVKTFLQ